MGAKLKLSTGNKRRQNQTKNDRTIKVKKIKTTARVRACLQKQTYFKANGYHNTAILNNIVKILTHKQAWVAAAK